MMIDDIAATSSYVSLFIYGHNCLFWLQSKYYKFASFFDYEANTPKIP